MKSLNSVQQNIFNDFLLLKVIQDDNNHNKLWAINILYERFGDRVLDKGLLKPIAKELGVARYVVVDYIKYKLKGLPHGKIK